MIRAIESMNDRRIYITGFMTSGKSTIGPILANVLGLDYFDLDNEIEKEEDQTVVEIFDKKGESYFREAEWRVLKKLSEKNGIVISLGGGTIMQNNNFMLLKSTGKIIYLKVSPDILYRRLKNKINRPLFKDLVMGECPKEDFIDRINEILNKRREYYEQADLIVEPEDQPFGLIVDKLVRNIKILFNEKN
jgi:shikimate kinase